jgi:hypothetical protein
MSIRRLRVGFEGGLIDEGWREGWRVVRASEQWQESRAWWQSLEEADDLVAVGAP